MKIRIDLLKLREMALSRMMILLFFLVGIFFSVVRPVVRISEIREKIARLERAREEGIIRLEAGERKVERVQREIGILESERARHLKQKRDENEIKGELPNLSAMKSIVAGFIIKNGIEIESIGRAALMEIKDGDVTSGKKYEAVVPYSIRGYEEEIKRLFVDFRGRKEGIGLKSTPLEIRYAEREGRKYLEVKFRVVGIVGESRESDEIKDLPLGRDEGLGVGYRRVEERAVRNYDFRSKIADRGYITINGKNYEVKTMENGRKSMGRVIVKTLEKTH